MLTVLFTFAHSMKYCFNFLVTHSTKRWLGFFIYLVFHIVSSNYLSMRSTQRGFRFNFQVTLFTDTLAISMFLFHLLILAFTLQTFHTFFCFSLVASSPSSNFVWIPSYSLYYFLFLLIHPTCFLPSWYTSRNLSISFFLFHYKDTFY